MLLQTSGVWIPWRSSLRRHLNIAQDASEFFEPRLLQIGLSEAQIALQDLPQLRASLERVNDAIDHPEGFGFLKITAEGSLVATMNSADAHIGPLPILLQRKKLIVERIAVLESEANVEGLRSLAGRAEPGLRQELQERIDSLESEKATWQQQARDLEDAQQKAHMAQQSEIGKIEVFERRSRVWQSFLERQSVATMVGAILLLAIFIFIVVAASSGTVVPELINNAFLVILGYFFGQAGSKSGTRPAE